MGTGMKGSYLGFTFNGIHSSDFGITRTSDGSRFNQGLLPTIQDKAAQIPGRPGSVLQSSNYGTKVFSVSFAYDGITESQLQKMSAWLGDKKIHELIFDEAPYKHWYAKVTGNASMKWIPFEEGDTGRIYKGEGTIQFTCYEPFAHCSNEWFAQWLEENGLTATEDDYKSEKMREWIDVSGLANTVGKNSVEISRLSLTEDGKLIVTENGNHFALLEPSNLMKLTSNALYVKYGLLNYSTKAEQSEWWSMYNCGDLPVNFKLALKFDSDNKIPAGGLYLGRRSTSGNISIITAITWREIVKPENSDDDGIIINTKMNLLEGAIFSEVDSKFTTAKTGNIYDQYINSGTYFQLPCGDSVLCAFLWDEDKNMISPTNYLENISCDYLYF